MENSVSLRIVVNKSLIFNYSKIIKAPSASSTEDCIEHNHIP